MIDVPRDGHIEVSHDRNGAKEAAGNVRVVWIIMLMEEVGAMLG